MVITKNGNFSESCTVQAAPDMQIVCVREFFHPHRLYHTSEVENSSFVQLIFACHDWKCILKATDLLICGSRRF